MLTTKYHGLTDEELLSEVFTSNAEVTELEIELALRLEKAIDDGDCEGDPDQLEIILNGRNT